MTNVARQMQIADAKAAAAKKPKRDKSRKGGEGRTGSKKASAPPPAGISDEADIRLIFPCPPALSARITAYWHGNGFNSKSAAIRALLERGLK